MEGAKQGAYMGPLFKGATGTLGQVFKGARTSFPDMKSGDDFIPANVAAPDSWLGGMMRDTVGRGLGGGNIRKQTQRVIDKAEKELTDSDAVYAEKLFRSSAPDSMNPADIDMSDPQRTFAGIKEGWNKHGFDSVKDNTFKVDDKKLTESIIDAVDDPALQDYAPALKQAISAKVGSKMRRDDVPPPSSNQFRSKGVGVERVPPTKSDTGEISGEDLMEARNFFRRKISDLGDSSEARLQGAAYAKAASKIDQQIREQLEVINPAALESFEKELADYGRYTVLRGGMAKAGKVEADLPTPKQIMASMGSDDKVAAGIAPHQALSKTELKTNAGLTEAVKKAKEAMPSRTGGVQQVAQAGIVGGLASAGEAPVGMWPALGASILKPASLESTQRLLTGQLPYQKMLEDILRRGTVGASREAAGHDY
jgi:hypothetical protein